MAPEQISAESYLKHNVKLALHGFHERQQRAEIPKFALKMRFKWSAC